MRIYLADNGSIYRVRLNCVSGENELLRHACEDLMRFVPSNMWLRAGLYNPKESDRQKKKKEKVPHQGRRSGRRPSYLLGK